MALTTEEQRQVLLLKKKKLELQMQQRAMAQVEAPVEAPVEPAPEKSGLDTFSDYGRQALSGLNKGFLDIANIPLAASGFLGKQTNKLLGYPEGESYDLYNNPVMGDAAKSATARVTPKGENAGMDAAFTFPEWAGTALMPGPKTADIVSGGGAAIGEYFGGQEGEVAGGLMGLIAALKGKDLKPVQKLKEKMFGPQMGEAPVVDKSAMGYMDTVTDNPELAKKNLEFALARGEKGSLADLTKDPGLYELENAMAMGSHKSRKAIEGQILGREQDIIKDVTAPLGVGSEKVPQIAAKRALRKTLEDIEKTKTSAQQAVEDVAETGLSQTRAAQQQAESMAGTASEQAQLLETGVAPTMKTAESSKVIKGAIGDLETKMKKDLVTPQWKEFEGGAPIEIKELQQVLSKQIDDLPLEQATDLVAAYKKTLSHIGEWKGTAKPESVQYVLSSIKDSVNTAKNTGNFGVLEKELSKIGNTIEGSLKNPLNRTQFEKAISASKQMYDTTGANTKIGKARLNEEGETFAQRINFAGDPGAGTGRVLANMGDPAVTQGSEEYLKGLARTEKLDEKFMVKYDQALDNFPDLKKQFQKVVSSKLKSTKAAEVLKETTLTSADKASALTKTAAKKSTNIADKATGLKSTIGKQNVSKYSDEPNTTITALINNRDGAKQLKDLGQNLELTGKGTEFKAHVGRELRDILTTGKGERVTEASVNKFKNLRPTLVDSGLLSNKQADDMLDALSRSDTAKARRQAGALLSDQAATETMNLFATGASATLLSLTNSSNQLAMMGAVRRSILRKLKEAKLNSKETARIEDLIASPETYLDVANNVAKSMGIKGEPPLDKVKEFGEKFIDGVLNSAKRAKPTASSSAQTLNYYNEDE